MHEAQRSSFCAHAPNDYKQHAVVLQMISMGPNVLQDEKQALHNCVRAALAETQNAAVADRAAALNGQDGDVAAAVNAQIQQRRTQKVLSCCAGWTQHE